MRSHTTATAQSRHNAMPDVFRVSVRSTPVRAFEIPPPVAVDYATLEPTSCLRVRREPGAVVIELLPAGFRDEPSGIAWFVVVSAAPVLYAVARVSWELHLRSLPPAAWAGVMFGTPAGREALGMLLLGLAGVAYFAGMTALAWKGRSTEGPATFHLFYDGRIAKRYARRPCWHVHRENVAALRRRGRRRLDLLMRPGHCLYVCRTRPRDVDWLERVLRRHLGHMIPGRQMRPGGAEAGRGGADAGGTPKRAAITRVGPEATNRHAM